MRLIHSDSVLRFGAVIDSLTMSEFYDLEIERLNAQLADIYRRGRLTPTEKVKVDGLWARIERLDAAHMLEELAVFARKVDGSSE